MTELVPDLQYRLNAEGRGYLVELRAPGAKEVLVTFDPFEVHILAHVPANFADFDDDQPEDVVMHIVQYVQPLIPSSVTPNQWIDFAVAVLAWVKQHRHAAACLDWQMERRELESSAHWDQPEG